MSRLRKFLFLPRADRKLLLRAALFVTTIRLGLWLMPYPTFRRLLQRMTQIAARLPTSDYASIDRVAWAVTTASRYVPRATCLTQALAAQLLLTRHGLPFSLYVGVAKDQREKLVAHAWVESQGKIVIGGSGLGQYTPLLVLKGEHLWVQSPRSTR